MNAEIRVATFAKLQSMWYVKILAERGGLKPPLVSGR